MRKAIVMMLLAVVSSSAAAEWIVADFNDTSTDYADRTTIRKAGDLVRMWDIADYKTVNVGPDGKQYMSMKRQHEYDCRNEKARTLLLSVYTGHMGGGEVVYSRSDPDDQWEPVPPETMLESLWKVACGKK
jgi:hypothetical protein